MQLLTQRGDFSVGCLARQRNPLIPCPTLVATQASSSRCCQLACSASLRSLVLERSSRCMQRRHCRRQAVVCRAAAKSFYEVLGVPQSAGDRDIKSAYRKLAMKLHPDVNKASDAQQRFMEVKVAYETLSDARQRAEYDRRLRMGGYSSASARSSGGYGSSSSYGTGGGSWGSYGSYDKGSNFTQETVSGLDDLIRELEKEFTTWANSRGQGARSKSLMEELEDLGGEFLDFLEQTLGIKDEPSSPPGSTSQQQQRSGGGNAAAADSRSAAERFDGFWQQYGTETDANNSSRAPPGGAGSTSSSSGSTNVDGQGGSAGSGARSGSSSGGYGSSSYNAGSGNGSSTSSGAGKTSSSSSSGPTTTSRSSDDDIEAQLLALKKKLNKL